MEKWKNNNKPMRRKSDFVARNEVYVGLFMHRQGFFGHFFFAHTISWAHYRLIVE
jgi:hypothetical protein